MALQASDIADLVVSTLKELGRLKWTDMTGDLQEYVAMPNILTKERVQFDDGNAIQFNLMTGTSGAAKNVGLFQTDDVNVGDTMITGSIPWRHTTTNYAFDRRELAMNRGASRIVDLLKIRRADAMIDLAKRMETDFWSKPATSDDTTTPYGVQMYAVKNSTEGFTGGDPTGFSSGTAGIATATYARWKNYSGSYTNKTRADLITKMRKAATYTNFKAPIDIPQYNGSSKYGYYTTYNVVSAMETIAEDQNENLGNDVASKDGIVTFRRTPITWVPQLDADTSDPIYGLNWGVMNPVFLKGEYMREEPETKVAGQHTTFAVHVDTTYNLLCRDRRKQFVLYIA